MKKTKYISLTDGKYIDADGNIMTIKNGKFNWSCWSRDEWHDGAYGIDDKSLRPFSIKHYYNMFL